MIKKVKYILFWMIKKIKYILFWVTILFVILLFKSQLDAFICNHLTLLNYEYIGTKISYIILVIIACILLSSKIKIYDHYCPVKVDK